MKVKITVVASVNLRVLKVGYQGPSLRCQGGGHGALDIEITFETLFIGALDES